MKRRFAIGLILFMLFNLIPNLMVFPFMPNIAMAASNSLITLENVTNEVFVKRGGGLKEYKGINGMEIFQGDTVRAGKEGYAQLKFCTGSKMTIASNTIIVITTADSKGNSSERFSIKLKAGNVWNDVKSLVNTEGIYEIETPTTVMGVRGTQLLVSVDPDTGAVNIDIMEGSVAAHYNYLRNTGAQEQLLLMGNSISIPEMLNRYAMPPPPPPPAHLNMNSFIIPPVSALYLMPPPPPPPPVPINMNNIIDHQDPFILANMAMDVVDRMQELQQQSQLLLENYQNTNNSAYIQGALQQSQINTFLGNLSQQFMDALQNSEQEDRRNQIDQLLQEQNQMNINAMNQQMQIISNQAQETRQYAIEGAQRGGLNPDQIQRLLENARSSGFVQSPGIFPVQPPNGGGSSDDDDSDWGYDPGENELVQAVRTLGAITVEYGVILDNIDLPTQIEVTLDEQTTQMLDVVWDGGTPEYDPNQVGEYQFSGEIQLIEGIINPQGMRAQLTVTVNPPVLIQAVRTFGAITVEYGTSFEEIDLPEEVEVTLEDQITQMLDVIWDGGTPEYDPNQEGDYQFSGEIQLIEGIINPQGMRAQLTVTVNPRYSTN